MWILISYGSAAAHEFAFTEVLVILRGTKTYQIEMTLDVDALALGVPPSTDPHQVYDGIRSLAPEDLAELRDRAQETLQRRVRVEFDGKEASSWISFPDEGRPLSAEELPTYFGVTARFSGTMPAGASEFTFGASRAFGPVHLTVFDQGAGSSVTHVLGPSEDSPPFLIGKAAPRGSWVHTAADYLVLGFTHILPHGLDHILFVIGLFLLSTKWRPLLWQITAFTAAHTITLALSITGVVELPSRVVEPLIALSIAYVALENLFTDELKPWRPALVFGFGLLHGLGFAGVLRDLGLPPGEMLTALLSFNIGVELGQLAVVLLAFAAVGWARKTEWYRSAIVKPISAAIALTGLYWFVQRAMFGA